MSGETELVNEDLVLCCVVIFAAVMLSYVIQRYRLVYLPPSGAAMLLGMCWGGIIRLGAVHSVIHSFEFEPETFFYGLLPPIIYSAGFSLKQKMFFQNFSTIVLFAVVGTLLSTFVFGLGTYALYAAGAVQAAVFSGHPLLDCLIYGALVSATDPVATLSIFSDVSAPPLLYNLVFGESVLNDAVAIVLFRVLTSFHEARGHEGGFTAATVPLALAQFVALSVGSALVGVLLTMLCALTLKHLHLHQVAEGASPAFDIVTYSVSILFLSAYLSYLAAELAGLSGIMALFFAGIGHAHYCFYNVSPEAQTTCIKAFETLAFLSETFVFVYLGMQVTTHNHYHDWGLMLSAIPLCVVARACNIFPLAWVANKRRKRPITMRMQVMQWACGLRGAIAYALSMMMPTSGSAESDAFESTTLMVVVFSTLVFGGSTAPLLKALGLRDLDEPPASRGRADSEGGRFRTVSEPDPADASAQHLLGGGGAAAPPAPKHYEGLHKMWKHLDRRWLVPVLRREGTGAAAPAGPPDAQLARRPRSLSQEARGAYLAPCLAEEDPVQFTLTTPGSATSGFASPASTAATHPQVGRLRTPQTTIAMDDLGEEEMQGLADAGDAPDE